MLLHPLTRPGLAVAVLPAVAWAQGIPDAAPPMIPSFENTRSLPIGYTPPEPATEQASVSPLRLRLGADFPLRTTEGGFKGAGFQGSPAVSPTLQLELRYNSPSYWFGGITFYRYLMDDRQRPWNPDFTYTFGYDDWHPNTFSLVYGNYTGNRIAPDRGRQIEGQREERTRFSQGTWTAAYKFAPSEPIKSWFVFDESHQLNCAVGANYTRRYTDLQSLSLKSGKRSLSLGCRYTTPGNWFASWTLFHYPKSRQRQPWDPDFIYGFGYSDYRPGTVSIQYNNYSGNRYPWHTRSPGQGRLRNGSISVSWSTEF